MTQPEPAPTGEDLDVPSQIFRRTLHELTAAGVPTEVLSRLRQTLLIDRTYTELALKRALFANETSP